MPVTEPRDEIDDWLGRDVEPLPPTPGAFERIHRRARRRKMNQSLLAAAGAVVVIAAAVTAPQFVPALLHGGSSAPQPVAGGTASPASHSPKPATSAPSPSDTPTTPSGTPPSTGTGLSTTSSGTVPPHHFRPTSITMIGRSVGAVIGQAGPPCATKYCTSLAGTSTYGKSWYGVSAPLATGARGSAGVSQLRFLNLLYGWAFGPALWETSDGGRTWTRVPTSGLRVTDLEAAGNRAFALFAHCIGSGPTSISSCTTYSLYSAAAGSTTWQPVKLEIPAGFRPIAMGTAGHLSAASIVLAGGSGYLLTPSGAILSGPLDGTAWTYLGTAACAPGVAWPDGQPMSAQLAVSNGRFLINCPGVSGSTQSKQLLVSSDGGHWTKLSQPPASGLATSLASSSADSAVLATTTGIDYSPDGKTWQAATITGGPPQGGFSYVGMTSAQQGVAVPADASGGRVFTTQDGGQTWNPSPISGG